MTNYWEDSGTYRANYPWRHGSDLYDYVIRGSGDLSADHQNLVDAITATAAAAKPATIWIEGEVRYRGDYLYTLNANQSIRGRGASAILRCDSHTLSTSFWWNNDVVISDANATATDVYTPSEFSEYLNCPTYTPTKGDWFVVWSWNQITGLNPHYGYGFGQYPMELHQVFYWDNSAKKLYVPSFLRDNMTAAGACAMQVIPAAQMSKRVVLSDITFRSYASSQLDSQQLVVFDAIDGLTLENVTLHRNGPGAINFRHVANTRISGLNIQGSVGDENVYGVVVSGCNGLDISDFNFAGTRHAFTTTSTRDTSGTAVTSASISSGSATWSGANSFRNGMAVRVQTAITGFSTGTNYWVVNATGSTFGLSASQGGSAITAGANGSSNIIWQNCRFGTPLGVHLHDGRCRVQTKIETAGASRVGIDTHAEGWNIKFSNVDIYLAQDSHSNVGIQSRSRQAEFHNVRVFGGSSPYGYGFLIGAEKCSLVCCECHNLAWGIQIRDESSSAHSSGVHNGTIRDCRFETVSVIPIHLQSGNNHRITSPIFRNCGTSNFNPNGVGTYQQEACLIQIEYGTGHEIYTAAARKFNQPVSFNIGPLATTDVTICNNMMTGYAKRNDANSPTLEIAKQKAPVTASASTDKITWTAHPLANGDYVKFWTQSGGTLPTGVSAGTWYYVVNSATNDFEVSATYGGAKIDLTSDGSGNFGLTAVQQSLNTTYGPLNFKTTGFTPA